LGLGRAAAFCRIGWPGGRVLPREPQGHGPGAPRGPGDDGGKATAAGAVELGGFMNADANPVGDGSGHGGVLREEVV